MSQDKSKKDLQAFLKGVVKKAKQETKKNKDLDPEFTTQAALFDTTAAILSMAVKNIDSRIAVLEQCGKTDLSKLCKSADNLKSTIYLTFINPLLPSYAKTSYRELHRRDGAETDGDESEGEKSAEDRSERMRRTMEIVDKLWNFDYVKKHFIDGVPLSEDSDEIPEGETARLRNIAAYWTNSTMLFIWRATSRKIIYRDFEDKEQAGKRLPRLLSIANRQFEAAVKNGQLDIGAMGTTLLSVDIASLLLGYYGVPRVDTRNFDNHNLGKHTARVVCGNISFGEMCQLACVVLRDIRKIVTDTQALLPAAIERFHAEQTAFKIGKENE